MDYSIVSLYRNIFGKTGFYGLSNMLYRCGLHGLGVLNYESNALSGESRFLSEFLKGKTDCIVLDVGANVGKYSMEILQLNPTTTIHAFEPHPANFRALGANVRHPRFHAYNVAVGSEAGTLSLFDYAHRDGSGHASLYKGVIETIHGSASVSHQVEVLTLDSFMERNAVREVDLLKIDTEGNELNVLKGAERHVRAGRIKAIHFEFNEMNVISRTFFKDFWDFLPNYRFYRLLPDGVIPIETYSPVSCEIFAYQNLVAILK